MSCNVQASIAVGEDRQIPANKRKRKIWHVVVVLLGILALAFGAFRVAVRAQLRSRIDAVHAAGYPVSLTELDQWYEISPLVPNAADYITTAFTYMKIPRGEAIPLLGTTSLPPRAQPLDSNAVSLIDKLLTDNAKALELLRQGAAVEHSRYLIDLEQGQQVLLPHLTDISGACRLLALEAILHAERNEPEAAAHSIISVYGLARSLRNEPVSITQMVRHTCERIADQALERVLNRTALTNELLIELEQATQAAYDPNAMVRALAGERCLGHAAFRHPRTLGLGTLLGGGDPSLAIIEVQRAVGLLDRSWVIYLDLMEETVKAAQLPFSQRHDARKAIDAKQGAISEIHVMIHAMTPSCAGLLRADMEGIACLFVAQTSLAVERYRLTAGHLPDRLEDLVPTCMESIPPDPFDGQPLRYRRLPTGYVVYSIGRDETDDGGKERPRSHRGSEHPNYDLTFVVER